MKKLLLTTALLAAMTGAHAYQVEFNGSAGYAHLEEDVTNDNFEGAGVGANMTYYLNDVQAKNLPLAEAAFTSQASNISVGYNYIQTNKDMGDDIRAHDFVAGGEFFIPASMLTVTPATLYVAANFNRPKLESVASNAYLYQAEVGVLPMANLLLTVGAVGYDGSIEGFSDSETDPFVRAKYLTQLGGNTVNLETAASFGKGHDSDTYQASGDFYVDNTFSVGAGYFTATIKGEKDPYAVNLNARKFVASNLSLQGGISFGKGLVNLNTTGSSATKGLTGFNPTANLLLGGYGKDDTTSVAVGATYRF